MLSNKKTHPTVPLHQPCHFIQREIASIYGNFIQRAIAADVSLHLTSGGKQHTNMPIGSPSKLRQVNSTANYVHQSSWGNNTFISPSFASPCRWNKFREDCSKRNPLMTPQPPPLDFIATKSCVLPLSQISVSGSFIASQVVPGLK